MSVRLPQMNSRTVLTTPSAGIENIRAIRACHRHSSVRAISPPWGRTNDDAEQKRPTGLADIESLSQEQREHPELWPDKVIGQCWMRGGTNGHTRTTKPPRAAYAMCGTDTSNWHLR